MSGYFQPEDEPWRRCRCVFRFRDTDPRYSPGPYEGWPDDFIDRCPHQATQEDGLCDHCRQPDRECRTCGENWSQCCRAAGQSRHFVAQDEPCWDRTKAPF